MTVGLKWGNQKNEITTLGVAFDEWDLTTRLEGCESTPLHATHLHICICAMRSRGCVFLNLVGLVAANGALFWLRPDSGPELSREPTESVLVAQLTLRSGENYKATLSAQVSDYVCLYTH